MNRNILARNIRHRLADMLGSQWTGALDAAMDEMLLEEIDHFDIIQILPEADDGPVLMSDVDVPWSVDGRSRKGEIEGPVHDEPNDGKIAWPLRKRPVPVDGDPYLKGIMDKD